MTPDVNGTAKYSHLESLQKQTGITPPELVEYHSLSFCPELAPYYEDFLELSKRRSSTEAGYLPLSFPEILAWATLNGIETTPFQLEVIGKLDAVWLKVAASKNK